MLVAACGLLFAAQARPASIKVDATVRGKPISRNLFGKFTEHLGRNVYQGAWAQVVVNPEFAPAFLWPNADALTRRLEEAAETFGQKSLVADSKFGIAAFWSASGAVRGRWIEGPQRHLQELRIGAGGGSIETGIFAPVHRVAKYELTLKGRADQSTAVRVQVLTAAGDPAGEVGAPLGGGWSERKYELSVRARNPVKGAPYRLRLWFDEPNRIELDRVLLFPADHAEGWEPEVVELMRNAKLPMLRFPGGNFVSGYHWEDAVGPLDERPVRRNPAWPELEWNHVGTDEWLRLCELAGAEPLICINAGNGSAGEARRWVDYCNGPASSPMGKRRAANGHPKPYGVRFWEVGNELYGSWQIGATDGEGYAPRYGEFVAAMKKADPGILFIANGLGALQRTPDRTGYVRPEWNYRLVEENGAAVRSISVHPLVARNAPEDADPVEVWNELTAFADGYMEYLDVLVGEPMRRSGLQPKVAITEMQIFTRSPRLPTNKSIAEALWLGSLLHSCFRSDGLVELLTHSALLNHGGGLGKNRGVVYADPVWWATHLYGSQPGTIPAKVEAESETFAVEGKYLIKRSGVPYLDAAALLAPDGRTLTLFVINRHASKEAKAPISVRGFAAAGNAEAAVVKGDSLSARNAWDDPGRAGLAVSSVTLRDGGFEHAFPPLSLTRFTIRAQ